MVATCTPVGTSSEIACPGCNRKLVAPVDQRVRMVCCPKCGHAWDLSDKTETGPYREICQRLRIEDFDGDMEANLNEGPGKSAEAEHLPLPTYPEIDAITDTAVIEQRVSNAAQFDTLVSAVCAELDRRRMPYLHENVHAFVMGNYPATANPFAIADRLQVFAEWLATGLWNGEAPIDMWRD